MQKLRLVFYFILFISFARAQVNFAWYPVVPSVQYNYKADTSALAFSVVIRIDSSASNNTLLYHLNKVVIACDTCRNSLLMNDFFDSTYILVDQPQFLGNYFCKIPGNAFYFKGQHAFTLRPCDSLGASWLFDSTQNVTAVIIGKTVQPTLGISDSLVFIRLSTNDTIVCSKNSGIVQFPFTTLNPHTYRLAGYEGAINAGIKLKKFHDFFNFTAGDVLQYAFRDDDFTTLPPFLKGGRDRWDILAVSIYPDSVCCNIRETYLDSSQLGGGPPAFTAYTATLNITFIDSAQHPANLYPLQEINVTPYFLYSNGIRFIHKMTMGLDSRSKITKSFGQNCPNEFLDPGMTGAAYQTFFTNVYLNRNSSRIVGRELAEGLGFTSELFNNYDRVSQRCLVGYIKGADSSGTIYNNEPLSIRSITAPENRFTCYPNPAGELVTLKGPITSQTSVRILNVMGETIQAHTYSQGQFTHDIPTAVLANGIYFIVISDQASSEVKKLTIQH